MLQYTYKKRFFYPLLAFLLALGAVSSAQAIETKAREAILLDVETGTVLFEKDADLPMPPASMSKIMTIYMVFERLKDGRLSLDDTFRVSENAWRKGGWATGGSTMSLEPNERVRVEDLILGVIVQSGNDASIVLAEGISGSEEAFANEMNERGREMGLTGSTFRNATGWPHAEHLSTARDLATIARRTILDFPEYYPYYSIKEFTLEGKPSANRFNRNPLLRRNMGADGLKTGHTLEAGYGLTASAKRGDRRLIVVVNGLESKKERGDEPEKLLDWGFREFNNYALFRAGETVDEAEIWLGTQATVPLVIDRDVKLTLPRKARRNMKVTVRYEGPVPAPIAKGQTVATLEITMPDVEPLTIPLLAGEDVAQLGFFGRLGAAVNTLLWGRSQ